MIFTVTARRARYRGIGDSFRYVEREVSGATSTAHARQAFVSQYEYEGELEISSALSRRENILPIFRPEQISSLVQK